MSPPQREYLLEDREFQFISRLIREQAGIVINDTKRELVYSRITRRLRELGLNSFKDYCRLLENEKGDPGEMEHFVNALTTNLTSFFREPHHFEYLKNTLLPELASLNCRKRLRVWSAGCSSGEEPYTIAMTLTESLPEDWDIRILATELDSKILREAEAGIYPLERAKSIPERYLRRWFLRGRGDRDGLIRVSPELRAVITFRRLNLLHPWPFRDKFDVIFCRNVVIYFDKDTQVRLFDRFADALQPTGHLFIGHSESLFQKTERFKLIGGTVYRKTH